jgi:hypothetical protein
LVFDKCGGSFDNKVCIRSYPCMPYVCTQRCNVEYYKNGISVKVNGPSYTEYAKYNLEYCKYETIFECIFYFNESGPPYIIERV